MEEEQEKKIDKIYSYFSTYFNKNMLRSVFLFSGGIIIFVAGVIVYGIVINLREIPLHEIMSKKGLKELSNPNIIVSRQSYSLRLYDDTVLIKTYRANFGRNVNSPKLKAGDLATPVGDYKICEIDTNNKYYKFFMINYPNISDASDGLRKGLITQEEFDEIKFEYDNDKCINSNTPLGGDMGIHGIGRLDYLFKYLPFVYNWTDGSIALSNEDIDELYSVVKKGTKVVIK